MNRNHPFRSSLTHALLSMALVLSTQAVHADNAGKLDLSTAMGVCDAVNKGLNPNQMECHKSMQDAFIKFCANKPDVCKQYTLYGAIYWLAGLEYNTGVASAAQKRAEVRGLVGVGIFGTEIDGSSKHGVRVNLIFHPTLGLKSEFAKPPSSVSIVNESPVQVYELGSKSFSFIFALPAAVNTLKTSELFVSPSSLGIALNELKNPSLQNLESLGADFVSALAKLQVAYHFEQPDVDQSTQTNNKTTVYSGGMTVGSFLGLSQYVWPGLVANGSFVMANHLDATGKVNGPSRGLDLGWLYELVGWDTQVGIVY